MGRKAEKELIKLKLLYPDMVCGKDTKDGNNIILQRYKGNAETLTLPSSIKKIGRECFTSNKHIKHIKMLSEDFVEICHGAFFNSGLCSIEMQAENIVIGSQAFCCCDNLRYINLDNCIELGDRVFKNSGIDRINISEKTSGSGLKGLCEEAVNLKKAKIGKQIECTGMFMFSGCKSLTDIELLDGLRRIEYGSFRDTGIKGIVLPASVEEVEDAFGNSDLEHIVIKSNNLKLHNRLFVDLANLRYITASRNMIGKLKKLDSRFDCIQYNYID